MTATTGRVLQAVLGVLLFCLLIAGLLVAYEVLKTKHAWGTASYSISFEGVSSGYSLSKGVFTPVADIAPRTPEPIRQSADGLTYCRTADTCTPLIAFGAPVGEPVAYTLDETLLVFVHPLTRELHGYDVSVTESEVTVAPRFALTGLLLTDATDLVRDTNNPTRFVFVRSALVKTDTTETRACYAQLSEDYTAITHQDCATILMHGEPAQAAIHSVN